MPTLMPGPRPAPASKGEAFLLSCYHLRFHEIQRQLSLTSADAMVLHRGRAGSTCVHGLLSGLVSFKAGDVSRLFTWVNASFTLYAHDYVELVMGAVLPLLRELLRRHPPLARLATSTGVSPLHVAALTCNEQAAEELLRAGAPSLAVTADGLSVLQLALNRGCAEMVRMLPAAAPEPSARHAAAELALKYASLPGAAVLPSDVAILAKLLPPSRRAAYARARPLVGAPPPADSGSGTDPAAACEEGGGWDVEPPPTELERSRCEIDQISAASAASLRPDEYFAEYYRPSRPLLIRGATPLRRRCAYARTSAASREYKPMSCGRTAYPSLTGQRACGVFKIPQLNDHPTCRDADRTRPVCAMKPDSAEDVNASATFRHLPAEFRQEAAVPVVPFLSSVWSSATSRQIFAGGGSGAALHFHTSAYNVQLFGVKRWLLTPPRHAGITGSASTLWRDAISPSQLPAGLPMRCTQGPGDMMLLPHGWGHATVNDKFNLGIGNLFCDRDLANLTMHGRCSAFTDLGRRHGRPSSREPRGEAEGGGARFAGPGSTRELVARLGRQLTREGATLHSWGSRNPEPVAKLARDVAADVSRAAREGPSGRPRAHGLASWLSSSWRPPSAMPPAATQRPPAIAARAAPVGCGRGGRDYRSVAFVHVNKAGGTAMRAALARCAAQAPHPPPTPLPPNLLSCPRPPAPRRAAAPRAGTPPTSCSSCSRPPPPPSSAR